VRGLSGSGFESVDLTDAVAATNPDEIAGVGEPPKVKLPAEPRPTPQGKKKQESHAKEKAPAEAATSLAERRAQKRQAALEEARTEFEAADQEATAAEEDASKAWNVVKEVAGRRSDVEAEIAKVKKRLASLEAELIGITRDAEAAESQKKLAVRTATQQRRVADRARRRVERLA
jgi:hypothetical protein